MFIFSKNKNNPSSVTKTWQTPSEMVCVPQAANIICPDIYAMSQVVNKNHIPKEVWPPSISHALESVKLFPFSCPLPFFPARWENSAPPLVFICIAHPALLVISKVAKMYGELLCIHTTNS